MLSLLCCSSLSKKGHENDDDEELEEPDLNKSGLVSFKKTFK